MTEAIYKALELQLQAFDPTFPTAWENVNYEPPYDNSGPEPEPLPYQATFVLMAKPENPTMGDNFFRQRGYMQVSLRYPPNKGAGDARRRAGMLRDHFRRGLSMTSGGVTTTVEETPEIGSGSNDGDRYVINVFVRFYANIQGA
jgi:hypothetical protein